MRLTLRYYLKKKWDEYKKKINQAVNESSKYAVTLYTIDGTMVGAFTDTA